MPPTTSSVSQTVSSITLTVSSGNPPTIISQQFDTSTLTMGANSIQITNPGILSRYAEPGLQHSHSLFLGYGGELSHVSTAAAVSDFVATPLILSNFGPSFNYAYVSGGVGTFTLQPPSCNNSSLTNFLYTSGNTSIATVGLKTGIVTLVGAGTTTVTASLPKEGGYTNASIVATLVINPIAPTFSNGGVFTISSKNFGDAPFTPAYPTSNSLGAFTYTSSATSIATVHPTTGVVTIVAAGSANITATQAAAGNYVSGSIQATLAVANSVTAIPKGFSVITNSDFTSLDFNTGMTTLFPLTDSISVGITMPNQNFKFNNAVYSNVYLSSKGALYFDIKQAEYNFGTNAQIPINSFRFFGDDHMSIGSYKFDSNNTRLLINLTGYKYGQSSKTFTIKLIIDQSGVIQMNYTLASTYTADVMIIGYVGSSSTITSDDIFLTLDGFIFNHASSLNLYSLLNGKTILYNYGIIPTFGPFTLPSDISVYTGTTITRQLTPPTSNSNGAFSYTSSNTAVATITNNAGVYSINVIGGGYTGITATQAASGDYQSSSVMINTITGNIGVNGFYVITNSDFTSLDFNTGMTTLFPLTDSISVGITMPNQNFKFNNAVYSNVYLSSKGALYFDIKQAEYNFGTNAQIPINSFRFFGDDHMSIGSYKFDSNNTRLLINLTGYKYGQSSKTFTIKLIIDQSGVIQMNYTLASTYTADVMIIGYVGSSSTITSDDIFLTLDGFIFNHASSLNLYSLLNGKTILYI